MKPITNNETQQLLTSLIIQPLEQSEYDYDDYGEKYYFFDGEVEFWNENGNNMIFANVYARGYKANVVIKSAFIGDDQIKLTNEQVNICEAWIEGRVI